MPGSVGIVEYGLGNLTSVAAAVEKLGFKAVISADEADLGECERLILPGVGAFGNGMENLRQRGLVGPLTRMVMDQGKPILGICLGSHLMAKEGTEFGCHEGLGWIDARVIALRPDDPDLRVPHVGWNDLVQMKDCPLFDGVPADALFYYVHSFHIETAEGEVVIGECDYGGRFAAALQWRNVFTTQFHPEKSQRHGLTLLGNFLALG